MSGAVWSSYGGPDLLVALPQHGTRVVVSVDRVVFLSSAILFVHYRPATPRKGVRA